MDARKDHPAIFYELLQELEEGLGGTRCLKDCGGRRAWPRRGVYFFQERGEVQSGSGEGPRIVRVGTHALKAGSRTSLWNRLSQNGTNVRCQKALLFTCPREREAYAEIYQNLANRPIHLLIACSHTCFVLSNKIADPP